MPPRKISSAYSGLHRKGRADPLPSVVQLKSIKSIIMPFGSPQVSACP